MSSAQFNPKTGKVRIFFRYDGRQFNRTMKVASERAGSALCEIVDQTMSDLERGRISLPAAVDLPSFLLSGGKVVRNCFKNGSRPRKPRENKHFARFLKQSLMSMVRTQFAAFPCGLHPLPDLDPDLDPDPPPLTLSSNSLYKTHDDAPTSKGRMMSKIRIKKCFKNGSRPRKHFVRRGSPDPDVRPTVGLQVTRRRSEWSGYGPN